MRRTYKIAEAGTAPGGYAVRLDGQIVRTPLKNPLLLQSQPLAAAIAEEWAAQENDVRPMTMPMTRLANTMVDKARGPDRPAMNAELLKYGGSDLICYFAVNPPELVRLHEELWNPLHTWLNERYGIAFKTVSGIQYREQPLEALNMLKKAIDGLNAAEFTVVQSVTATTGSVAIALALLEERLSAEEAYQASCVDEIYQLKTWGADELAQQRLDMLKSELEVITRFAALLKASL